MSLCINIKPDTYFSIHCLFKKLLQPMTMCERSVTVILNFLKANLLLG